MIKKISKSVIVSILRLFNRILILLNKHLTRPYKFISRSISIPSSPYELFEKDEINDCYNHFKKYFYEAIFLEDLREFAIERAIENDSQNENFYLEFGVYVGTSIKILSSKLKNNKIHGFDSFEGLKEDWIGTCSKKGIFDLKGIVPKLPKNVIPIKGWVQNTLPIFIEKNKNLKINFVHMDMDTYKTTKYVLQKIKPYLINNAVILFDELYNFSGWKFGEYKALKETFNDDEYKYLAFAQRGPQAIIQIIKK